MLLRFGPFEADTSTQELRKFGIALKLPPQAFQVLALLLNKPGELLTREQIQQELWPSGTVVEFDHSINTAIKKIRACLGDARENPIYLETLSRRGYRFVAAVERIDISESAPPAPPENPAPSPLQNDPPVAVPRPAKSNRTRWLLLAAAGLAVFALLIWKLLSEREPHIGVIAMTALTDAGDVWDAAVSPDGKYVVTLRRDALGSDHLWVEHLPSHANNALALDSSKPIRDVSFSADSNYIYYRAGGDKSVDDLYKVPVSGGVSALVVSGVDSSPAFSVLSDEFYFLRSGLKEQSPVLVRAKADGTPIRTIPLAKDSSFSGLAVSDRSAIAVLEDPPGSARTQIAVVDPSSGKTSFIGSSLDSNLSPRNIVWMPGGRGLLVRFRDANTDRNGIGYLSYPSGRFLRVTKDLNNYASISVSAQAGIVATLAPFEIELDVYPWQEHITEADAIALGDADWVDWISNDLMVASDGELTLRTIALSTQERKPLLPGNSLRAYDPSICGPGAIAFTGVTPDSLGNSQIYMLSIPGGSARKLTNGPRDQYTRCTPDGKTMVYYSFKERSLMRIPAQGGSAAVLLGPSSNLEGVVAIESTGKQVFTGVKSKGSDGSQQQQFVLVDLRSGHIDRTVPAPGNSRLPSFTPAGGKMVYVRSSRHVDNFWIQTFEGTDLTPLTNFQLKRCVSDQVVSYAISPDGKHLAITRNRHRGDVVTLEAQGLPE